MAYSREEHEAREQEARVMSEYPDFISKITALKEGLARIAGEPVALNVTGYDVVMRMEFHQGFAFQFMGLDDLPEEEADEYAEDGYDELSLMSADPADRGVTKCMLPLLRDDFDFAPDASVLDEEEDPLPYDHVVFAIRMETVDYVFTRDL